MTKNVLGDYSSALNDFSKVIAFDSKNESAFLNRAISKQKLGDIKGAIEDYSVLIRLNEYNPEYYFGRGELKIQIGEKEAGCLDLKKFSELGGIFTGKISNFKCN